MATEQSLFGATPESIQQARDAALNTQASQYAQLDPFQQASFNIYRGANQLGGAVGGMLGGQDPELQRMAALQQAGKSADMTPDGLRQYANSIKNIDPNAAFRAVQQAAKLEDELTKQSLQKAQAEWYLKRPLTGAGAGGKIGTVNPKAYTPESMQLYSDSVNTGSPDYSLLVPADPKEKAMALTLQGKRAREEGYIVGTPEFQQRVKEINQEIADKVPDRAKADVATVVKSLSSMEERGLKTDKLLAGVSGPSPKVFFGPVSNFKAFAESTGFLGEPSDNTQSQDEIRAHLTGSINEVLNEAKGVQAKDDAIRAQKQILGLLNLNTNAGAVQALTRLKEAELSAKRSNEAYLAARVGTAAPKQPVTPSAAKPVDMAAAFERQKKLNPQWANYTLEQFIQAAGKR